MGFKRNLLSRLCTRDPPREVGGLGNDHDSVGEKGRTEMGEGGQRWSVELALLLYLTLGRIITH